MALRRDPLWVDLAEDDDDSDLGWHESDGLLGTLLPESWRDFEREKVLQRSDEIEQELGATQMCCETMLRRGEECAASTYEDSDEQQSYFERTEDSDSQGRWDTNIGEMWTSL